MNVAISDHLKLSLPPGAASVTLTPGQAFDLAEDLIRCGVRRAMEEETEVEIDALPVTTGTEVE